MCDPKSGARPAIYFINFEADSMVSSTESSLDIMLFMSPMPFVKNNHIVHPKARTIILNDMENIGACGQIGERPCPANGEVINIDPGPR